MICKKIFLKLSEYIDRDIDPKICDKIDQHIANCKPCQAFINTFRKTVNLLRLRHSESAVPPDTHRRLHQRLHQHIQKKG
jgi:hypothetical protein